MEIKTVKLPQRLPPKGKISFEEFLAWCDEDTWAEWVDGEVIMISPASMEHQDIGSWVERSSQAFGCKSAGSGKRLFGQRSIFCVN